MLSLRKKKIVLSLDLNNITTDDIKDALHGDISKQDNIVTQVMKLVRGATNSIKNIPEDFKDDFEQDTLIHILKDNGRVLSKFDDTTANFSTFIYSIVQNKWIDSYKKLLRERKETTSLDAPVSETRGDTLSLGEVVEDPTSLRFLQELQGTSLLDTILGSLSKREGDLLNFWIDSPFTGKERNQEVSENFNKKYPNAPLASNTVEQFMIRYIRPKVYKLLYGTKQQEVKEPEISETERLHKRIQELNDLINEKKGPIHHPETITELEKIVEPEEETKLLEEPPAPVYRINPQTGEKTRIAKKFLINRIKFINNFLMKLSKENTNGRHK